MTTRTAAGIDVGAIPEALAERAQWICWRAEARGGKQTKVPVDPSTGGFASTTDDGTWADLESALACASTDAADGIGFVFTAVDPFVGVDLDDCRDPETGAALWPAEQIIDRLDSFTEVSPSGTGYHVILEGDLPRGRNRRGSVEMYDQARFFTVTADHVEGAPRSVRARQDALEAVHAEYVAIDERPDRSTEIDAGSDTDSGSPPSLDLEDEELLERARAAKNGEKFERLWRGSTQGYASGSEADMALCYLLAFWTGRDRTRIDRLFRESGLMREKWDDVHYADGSTYGEKTVERAIANTTDIYEPPRAETDSTEGHERSTDTGHQTRARPDSSTEEAASTRAAYLAEKNQLLRTRVSALETDLERKGERLAELEEENQALRDVLRASDARIRQLEHRLGDQRNSSQESPPVWERIRTFTGRKGE
ncbi:phage NrS-1 polymerase family protein [Natronobiforma cellulositropha]|uniref:phage NrS-1 polymerase family protein n=1 Tax=Natronobiforma cellulositropha TaxID=1679076 RepID=UPI0021D581EE|nr:hypothetical protein [Natronobiforma cellulositropha]